MNAFTHLGIARRVQQVIENEYSVKLDSFAFSYGCIKPDISPVLVRIPHYFGDAVEFIKLQIEQLMNYKMNTLPNCTREFSEKMGVVVHYLADFFCYVHSTHYKGGTVGHYLYELHLSNYFKKHSDFLKTRKYQHYFQNCQDFQSICDYIDQQQNIYMRMAPSLALDMSFSIKICSSVCLSIISACMTKDIVIAA